MKLPSFRRINIQDFPEQFRELVEKLSVSINNGFEVVYEAINNRKISLRDNILCNVKDVDVIVDSSGTPTTTTTITKEANNSSNRIDGIQVINAINLTNTNIYPTSGVFISFDNIENGINLTNITGLQAGQKYRLRVVIWLI